MNISLAPHAAAGAPVAHAKQGKGGDPLADFMAMLGQLGITVAADGTLATSPQAAPAAQDIAAKLLAKLGKKEGDAKPQAKPGDPLPDAEAPADGKAKDDSITTLADLLAQIDPAATKSAESPKLDIAALIAAVRSFAAGEATQAEKSTGQTDSSAPATAPVVSTTAPSIAALLARASRASREDSAKPVAPGTVQSAFARLETLIAGTPAPENAEQASDATAKDQSTDQKSAGAETDAASVKLTDLLARLTASAKQGAVQSQAPGNAAAQAARPHVDPQLAALAQAIQRTSQDDKPTQDTPDTSAVGTSLGVTPTSAPGTQATASPRADAAPVNPSDELMKHHLDLARDTQWLDTLARDIARAAQSDNLLRFQLNPEHLGSLKVELLNGAHGTSVKLTADTEAARAILADAQPRLVAEARAQGLRISETQVDLSGHGGGQRHMAEAPVVIRTAGGSPLAEVEQDKPAASGERYA
jgi:flagellar hook-length control protein FliK